jgi:hypothetical protein
MSYRRVVVVVSGNKGAGKDTTADTLAELLPDTYRDAYAVPLKMCVHLKTGVPLEWLNDSSKKDDPKYGVYGQTLRKLMQDEGEETRQRISPTVWADRLGDRFQASPKRIAVVSDGRHPKEELEGLRERVAKDTLVLGVCVRRPEIPVNRSHVSESIVADTPDSVFDAVLMNVKTREHLVSEVVPQLADYVYLRALTEKRSPDGFIVRCPNGGRQRWPHPTRADATVVAAAANPGCPDCGSMGSHSVEHASFDKIILPR